MLFQSYILALVLAHGAFALSNKYADPYSHVLRSGRQYSTPQIEVSAVLGQTNNDVAMMTGQQNSDNNTVATLDQENNNNSTVTTLSQADSSAEDAIAKNAYVLVGVCIALSLSDVLTWMRTNIFGMF
jgi:hypothetical protein